VVPFNLTSIIGEVNDIEVKQPVQVK